MCLTIRCYVALIQYTIQIVIYNIIVQLTTHACKDKIYHVLVYSKTNKASAQYILNSK